LVLPASIVKPGPRSKPQLSRCRIDALAGPAGID
jgi:hypothetical protein